MSVPNEIRIGTTTEWSYSHSDYSPSAWSLTYHFISDDGTKKVSIDATAGTGEWIVKINPATSQNFTPGGWTYVALVTDGTDTYEVNSGAVTILPDPTAADITAFESHTKKVLDMLEAAMEGRASRTDLEYQIGNRKIKHMSPEQIYRLWKVYKIMYDKERKAASLGEQLGPGANVAVRFR